MPVSFDEVELRGIGKFLAHVFGVEIPDTAAADATTHTLIRQLQQQVQTMSDRIDTELSSLQADVAAQGTVIASATTAFRGLSDQLAAALEQARNAGATENQLAAVTSVHQAVLANTANLAAAIPQNTPSANDPGTQQPAPTEPTPNDQTGGQPAPGTDQTGANVPVDQSGGVQQPVVDSTGGVTQPAVDGTVPQA